MKTIHFKPIFISIVFLSTIILKINLYAQEGGYVNNVTVAQGDTLIFYISTSVSPFDMNIFKIEDEAKYVTAFTSITGGAQPLPDSSYANGCNWNKTYSMVIPDSWLPGAYRAEFPVANGEYRGVLFFVKPKFPGNYSKILLVLSTNTWQAYNEYGGKSLYDTYSSDNKRSFKVSLNRPAAPPLGTFGSADFYKYEFKFINWAYKNNIQFEFASNNDLDKNPVLLSNYKLVLVVGHNEYWSYPERNQVQKYVNHGGKLMIMAGNTCWWQIRFEDNFRTIVCYKDRALDPFNNITDSLVTVNWWAQPVNNPEAKLTGVSFRHGGYVNSGSKLPHPDGYGDYAAFNTNHWVFEGTGLKEGDQFGYDNAIVGYETDGAVFEWRNGIPAATGELGTPNNFRILGISPAISYNDSVKNTYSTMGMYYAPNRGVVFNAATTDWVDGLYTDQNAGIKPDPVVDRITKNVINKFQADRFPPEILSWNSAHIDSAIVNNDRVYLNNRNFLILPDSSVKTSIYAKDPYDKPVKFFWTVNGIVKGTDTSYTFTNTETNVGPKKYTVTANVYNSEDTAKINWNIFNTQLVISSEPDTVISPSSFYNYRVAAFNFYNDSLTYQLIVAPGWLGIDNEGVISGTAPQDTSAYQVVVRVNNSHNQSDIQAFNIKVSNEVTAVEAERQNIPFNFSLEQNYPNPFNPATRIRFSLPSGSKVILKIFDVLGKEVANIINGKMAAGNHEIIFNSNNLASGVYFYRLQAGNFIQSKKMILAK